MILHGMNQGLINEIRSHTGLTNPMHIIYYTFRAIGKEELINDIMIDMHKQNEQRHRFKVWE